MKCVHCLKDRAATKDHVFPKSWYTVDTPKNTQRLTAPSCRECNNKLGKIEQDLFTRLALCVSPDSIEASGISKKVISSLGIKLSSPKDPKEMSIRKNNLKKILKELEPYNDDLKPFPGFSVHKDCPASMQQAIKVPGKQLDYFSIKVIKGLEYCLSQEKYIELPRKLKVYFVDEENIEDVKKLFESYGKKTHLGPGFKIERIEKVINKHLTVLYRVTIWGKLIIYGSIATY